MQWFASARQPVNQMTNHQVDQIESEMFVSCAGSHTHGELQAGDLFFFLCVQNLIRADRFFGKSIIRQILLMIISVFC